jgi:KaiC/GvpD/RAD55 family RecA-like ATPase
MRETGEAPSYEDLCEDPQLEKSVRDSLKSFTGKIPSSRIKAAHLFTKLDNFRRYRVAWNTCQGLVDELRQPTIDTQKLMDLYTDAAQKSVTAHGLPHVTIGAENDVFLKKVRKIIKGNKHNVIPTGFKTFDKINGGFLRGSLVTLAGTSGSGKSLMASQMASHMAMNGYKVVIYSLEMTEEEEIARQLSRMSKVPMSKIVNPAKMGIDEKRKIWRTAKKYERKIKASGGLLRVVSPERDLTVDEALSTAKSLGYDVTVLDYISLFAGLSEEDQVRRLAEATRAAKVYAKSTKSVVIVLAQLKDDGKVKYSGAIRENSNNLWAFIRDEKSKETGILTIIQQKARNQVDFPFELMERYDIMTVCDVPDDYEPPVGVNDSSEKTKTPKRKHVI